MFSYLKFLIQSTNHHGVHSPFVFDYLTKGLYAQKRKFKKNNSLPERIILSTIAYFNCINVYAEDEGILKKIRENFKEKALNKQDDCNDLIIVRHTEELYKIQHLMHPQSLVIFQAPSKKNRRDILQNKNFRLILNFHHTIVISNRKEQQPQTFYLRY